jgi:hypothetical protein
MASTIAARAANDAYRPATGSTQRMVKGVPVIVAGWTARTGCAKLCRLSGMSGGWGRAEAAGGGFLVGFRALADYNRNHGESRLRSTSATALATIWRRQELHP